MVRFFSVLAGLAVVYILLDFAIDIRPSQVQTSYRFKITDLPGDIPRFLRRDNLAIVIIKRSPATRLSLMHSSGRLQDPDSNNSLQPDTAKNSLRSIHPEFFVGYAMGTDLGCPLAVDKLELLESCGSARYDFAGRALRGEKEFQNLAIPDYNFSNDFKTLTIRP